MAFMSKKKTMSEEPVVCRLTELDAKLERQLREEAETDDPSDSHVTKSTEEVAESMKKTCKELPQ